jgi:hypothetical protein
MYKSRGPRRLIWIQEVEKSCDCNDTKVLVVPIALTLIVKMNCSAILALLSCG